MTTSTKQTTTKVDKKSDSKCKPIRYGIAEEMCRLIFETLLEVSFPRRNPNWLKNSEGNNLQLDGYCESLELAFEYNGEQHYKFTTHFHKTREKFKRIQSHDKQKRDGCAKREVGLVTIPYTVKTKDLERFIRSELENLKVDIVNDKKVSFAGINFNKKYIESRNQEIDEALVNTLFQRCGSFTRTEDTLVIECKNCQHKLEPTYHVIIHSKYTKCPNCKTCTPEKSNQKIKPKETRKRPTNSELYSYLLL